MPGQATAVGTSSPVRSPRVERWFYIGVGLVAIVAALVGFGPSIVNTACRKAPLTLLVEVHGIVSLLWLIVFVAQTTLAATGRISVHRRLGAAASVLAVAIVFLGYRATITMARRGFDLSGDLNAEADPLAQIVFPLFDLVTFGALLAAGYWYRRRSDIHKRLMLLALGGGVMPAPLAHLIGHFFPPRDGALILIPIAGFLFASAIYDRITLGRVHRVSLVGAVVIFAWGILRAVVIGPSAAWHHFASWLVRNG